MHIRFFIPISAVVLGAAAAVLHSLQLSTGYDGLGLPISGNLYGYLLIALTAAAAVLLLAASSRLGKQGDFFAPMPRFWASLASAGEILLAAAGVCYILFSFGGALSVSDLLLGVFAVFAALCEAMSRRGVSDERSSRGRLLFTLAPVCFCVAWIVMCYRDHAADPVLWRFWCPLLAIAAFTLAFYYLAGIYCGRMFFRRAMFFSSLSVYLAVASLPGAGRLSFFLCLAGCALIQLSAQRMMLGENPRGD